MQKYTVKSGDTLSKIAENNKTDLKSVLKLNSIPDPNEISVGQIIVLPGKNYDEVISGAKSKLEAGTTWGTVWWEVKNALPETPNEQIDKALGKEFWSKPGAYETFSKKDEKISTDFTFDKIDTSIAGSTPAFIIPEQKKEKEVTIVDPFSDNQQKVEVVGPRKEDRKVEVIDIDQTPKTVTVEKEKPKPIGDTIRQAKPEDEPLRAFFNKFIPKEKTEEFKVRLDKGEKISPTEFGQYMNKIVSPFADTFLPGYKKISKTVIEGVPSLYNKTVGDWIESGIELDRELLKQEGRRQEQSTEALTSEYDYNPFEVSDFKLDIQKIDPQVFYPDNSNGLLVANSTPSILAEATPYKVEEVKRKSKLMKARNAFDDSVNNLELMRARSEKEIQVVLTGEENEQEFQGKLEEAYDKLQNEVYSKYNKDGIELAKQVADQTKKLSSSLQDVADLVQNDIEGLLDFSFKDAPGDIVEKSNMGFFDLIKDVESYNTYVKSAKDYNDYNDELSTTVLDEAKAYEDYERLESELRVLRTEDNEKFVTSNAVFDSMNQSEQQAHVNYYFQNQKDIDRIYDVAGELSDIYSFIEINQIKAQKLNDRSIAIGNAISNFSDDFVELVATKEFGDLLTAYATEKDQDVSKLIGALNNYNNSKQWLSSHQDELTAEAVRLETKQAAAMLEMQAGYEKINKFANDYTNELSGVYKQTKELEKLQHLDTMAYNSMKAQVNDVINKGRFLHPLKTWDLWKEHGAKEVLWEAVPILVSSGMEAGIEVSKKVGVYQAVDFVYGTDEFMKDMTWWGENIQKNILPSLASTARESLEFVQWVGGHLDSASIKLNNVLNEEDTIKPFLDKDGKFKNEVLANKFATWALTYLNDVDIDSEGFKNMSTKYDPVSIVIELDPANENKTYTLDEVMNLYGSEQIQSTSGVWMSKDYLKKELIKANPNIDPTKIPAGTEVVISVGQNKATDRMKQNEKERMWMAGEVAYDNFKTTKDGNIYDFVKREDRDKVITISMMNDFAAKGISLDDIPAGTEIMIPKFDQIPSGLSWMKPEKRLKLQARTPFWNVFWNEVSMAVGDPINYVWPVAATRLGPALDFAGGEVSRKLMEQARTSTPTGKISELAARGLEGLVKDPKTGKKVWGKIDTETGDWSTKGLNDFTSRVKSMTDWSHGLTEILRFKPVSNPDFAKLPDNTPFIKLMRPDITLDDPTSLATLSVLMTKFRGITLSKMLPGMQKQLIDMTDIETNKQASMATMDVKKAIFDISERNGIVKKEVKRALSLYIDNYTTNRNTKFKDANSFTKSAKNMQDFLDKRRDDWTASVVKDKEAGMFLNDAQADFAKKHPEEFYTDYYRRNKDIRVVDIAWEFMEATGLSEGRLRKLYEAVPDVEKLMEVIEKQFLDYQETGRYLSIYYQEAYNNLSPAGRMTFRELLQDPSTGNLIPDQKTFDKVKEDLLLKYPSNRSEILRGINVVQDYKQQIEWVRKYQEGSASMKTPEAERVLVPVSKDNNVELVVLDLNELPTDMQKSFGDEAFKVFYDPETKLETFVANKSKYKDKGLASIVMDYRGVKSNRKISMLYETPVGRSELSLRKTAVADKKTFTDFVDTDAYGRPMSDKVTYGDILNTAFMDGKEGWFNKYFAFDKKKGKEFRSDFRRIIDKMVENKKEEFVSKTSVRRTTSERYDITGDYKGANRMYNVVDEIGVRVSEYLDIRKFYGLTEELKALFDADPTHSLYRQLYDKLTVLKRNAKLGGKFEIEPINEMLLLLMDIKGKNVRPEFFKNFSLIKGLLTGSKLSSKEISVVLQKLKQGANNMVRNKTNAKIEARSAGKTAQEINSLKNEVRTSVTLFDGDAKTFDEMTERLAVELEAINNSLPEDSVKEFSTEELKKYNEVVTGDEDYFVGNVIPKFFTYITLKKIGAEALLDNVVKFSKDLNSTAVGLVSDVLGKGREYTIQVVEDATATISKSRKNKILFPTRPLPDSRILTEAADNLSRKYGFRNDLVKVIIRSPEHAKLPELEKQFKSINAELDARKKILVDLAALTDEKKDTLARLQGSLDSAKEQLIEAKKNPSDAKSMETIEQSLVDAHNNFSIYKKSFPGTDKIDKDIEASQRIITDAPDRLKTIREEKKKGYEKDIKALDKEVIQARADIKDAQILREKTVRVQDLSSEWSDMHRIIEDIKALPDEYTKEITDKDIDPNETFTVKYADGTTEEFTNNEGVRTSIDKFLRKAIESRSGYKEGSLHGHLLGLKERLAKGGDYISLGDEFPKEFLDDALAIDLAGTLGDIHSNKFDNTYFADSKTLRKMYAREIDLAEKEISFEKQKDSINHLNNIMAKMKANPRTPAAKLTDIKDKLKKGNEDLSKAREAFETAVEKGDKIAAKAGVGKYRPDRSGQGDGTFATKRRMRRAGKGTYYIDKTEYEIGTPVITKDVIDYFNQVKAPKIKNDKGVLVDNPNYGKTVIIDDYTDYGKGVIAFLKDNPNHFIEDFDYRITHVDDAIENEVSTSQIVKSARESEMKPYIDMLIDSDHGLGLTEEDLVELINLSFEFELPTTDEAQRYKQSSFAAFERLMPTDEKAKLNAFANKLEEIYRRTGKTDADKKRNELWETVATNKYEPEVTYTSSDTFLESKSYKRSQDKVSDINKEYDPNAELDEDFDQIYSDFTDELEKKSELDENFDEIKSDLQDEEDYKLEAEEIESDDPNRPRNMRDLIDGATSQVQLDNQEGFTKGYSTVPEKRNEYAMSVAGMLSGIKQALGIVDISPFIGKDDIITKGKWQLDSINSIDSLARQQFKLLKSTDGQYFDNGNLIDSVKQSAVKASEIFDTNNQEFFELLPEIYGAGSARSLADFKITTKARMSEIPKAIDYLKKRIVEKKAAHFKDTDPLRKIMDDTTKVVEKLGRDLRIERIEDGQKIRGHIKEIRDVMSRKDKSNRFFIESKNLEQLNTILKQMEMTDKDRLYVQVRIDKAMKVEKTLSQMETALEALTLEVKRKDKLFDATLELIDADIEKLRTRETITAQLDNILSGRHQPKGKGAIDIKEFSAELITDINQRLTSISRQKDIINKKLSKLKKRDGKHPLVRRYLVELADLDREADRLIKITKVAVPFNVAAANGIKFLDDELYYASKGIYTDSYKNKMRAVSALVAKGKKFFDVGPGAKAQKKLDIYFPTIKAGKKGSYITPLSTKWFKDWYFNLDRKHPTEVVMPRVDWKDLDGIDLSDSALAIKEIETFMRKVERHSTYPTIIDLSGELEKFMKVMMPEELKKVKIITKDLYKKELRSVIPGRGVHASAAELAALKELKDLMIARQGVWLFGENKSGVTSKQLSQSFAEKAISKHEAAALGELRKAHKEKTSAFIPTEDVTSLPQLLARNLDNQSMRLIGADDNGIITKKTPKLNLEQTFNLSNRFSTQIKILKRLREEKIGYQQAMIKISKSIDTNESVFVVGGENLLIDDLTREAIDDGIKLGVEFHFAKDKTLNEDSIYSYIKDNGGKIAKQTHDLEKPFVRGEVGVPKMVMFDGKMSIYGYTGTDTKMKRRRSIAQDFFEPNPKKRTPQYLERQTDEFKALRVYENELEKELSDEMNQWVKDSNKTAPRFIKEEAKYRLNVEEALSRWVTLERKDKIRSDFNKLSDQNIKMYRNNMMDEMRKHYGRELEKWEVDLIEEKVNSAKHITRLVNDYVFKFDMPDRITSQIRNMLADKVLYWYTLGSENPDNVSYKADMYKNMEAFMKGATKFNDRRNNVFSKMKGWWVWNVLLLRPSWYLWNNLGDSVRAVFAARDVRLMKDLQIGYAESTAKFLSKVGKEILPEGLTKGKKGFRIFDLDLEKKIKYVPSKKMDQMLEFKFGTAGPGQALTKAGELIDEQTLEWLTSSGLVQATTDPVYARRIIESMPENTWYQKLWKRGKVIKGDIEMFASQSEELRRQTLAFDLLFNKAYTIAQTERTIKKWLFDYRDITYAGQMMRTIFPFYTFHAKSLQLYFGLLAKAGPGPVQAGMALLEAMEKESEAMPSYMRDRIELDFLGLKGIYFLPHFGIVDHFKMILNPAEELEGLISNPQRAIFGLGFGPTQAAIIETATGDGYFDNTYTTDQLRKEGWSMEEIADYKDKNSKNKNIDKDKPFAWLANYSGAIAPLAGVLNNLFFVKQKDTHRDMTFLQSKNVREIMKFFGVNLLQVREGSLDEIAYVWNALNRLPPSLTNVYKKRLEKENPELFKYFSDYAALAWLDRVNKMDDNELKAKEGITKMEAVTVRKYYNLEAEKAGTGDTFLANNPIAQDTMNRYWATKGDKETHEAGLRKFEAGKMKSLVGEILGELGTVSDEKIASMDAMGIKHPYTKGLNKQELYKDLYDKNGDLRVRSAEDLVAILEKHGVIAELAEMMDTSKEMNEAYGEYKKLSPDKQESKRLEDAKYYHVKNIVNNILPGNLDDLTEEEAKKFWDKRNQLIESLINSNPEYKKRWKEEFPEYQKKYLAMNEDYINRWDSLINRPDAEEDFNFYEEFYKQPDWFQKRYFSKHPKKAFYYPIVHDYTKMIGAIVDDQKKTGEWDTAKQVEALNYLWGKQGALKAYDEAKPGVYNYVNKHRQVLSAQLEDDTKNYFDLFYQNKGDKEWDSYRKYYLDKPENEYKKITYPFMRTWTSLIEKDSKNGTRFSSDWFWSPNNAEARKLYGESHPLEDGKTKLDYQTQFKNWGTKLEDDPGKIYDLVISSDNWFKNEYFKNHPERKEYYPLALKLNELEFADGLKEFFSPSNKAIIAAWEKDKPGTIANKRFWKDYGDITDKDGRIAGLEFYLDPKNADQTAKHEANNPGANKAYSLWLGFEKLPKDTWLGRKARRTFLRAKPELQAFWNRNKEITPEEQTGILKNELYYTILDNVQAEGKGKQYYIDYFGAKANASKYLADNPDLVSYRDNIFKNLDPVDSTVQTLLEEYNKIPLQADKNAFLAENKELDRYFMNSVPPGIKDVWQLQRDYFKVTDREAKQKFLKDNPSLTEYWDVSNLPSSYFNDKKKFAKYQTEFNKANDYFQAIKDGDWELAEKMKSKLPEQAPDIRTEEGRWLQNKLYNTAMATWATTFGTYKSTLYFRSLPSWLRNVYYHKHPEAKIISITPISKSYAYGSAMEDKSNPQLAWARRMMTKYGKNMPRSINVDVEKIMRKFGEWENRTDWSKTKWSEWWAARSAKANGLRAKDLRDIPLLRIELARAKRTFSNASIPASSSKKYGIINPFLGAPVMLPELTVGLEDDIINNN